MNGLEREIGAPGLGANGEDLNVVLGRFQSWAATRALARPAAPATKPNTRQSGAASGKDAGDAREISYDQALRASRHRRSANDVAAGSPPGAPTRAGETTSAPCNAAVGAQPTDPAGGGQQAVELPTGPLEHRWPEVSFARASADLVAAHLENKAASKPAEPAAQGSQAKSSFPSTERPAQAAPATAARRSTGLKRAAGKPVAARPARTAVTPAKTQPIQNPASLASHQQAKPSFREVMKTTAAMATSPASPLANGKSTCLTLRVSDGEQARIQACAAHANLSVSAYLRQCALGVDELRNQVEAALAKLQKEQERELPPPGLAAIPGILRRFGMRCLQGFRRTGNEPAVSIR